MGTGAADAAARTQSITLAEVQAAGVTNEIAHYWLKFYNNAAASGKGGATAAERVKLFERIIELLDSG